MKINTAIMNKVVIQLYFFKNIQRFKKYPKAAQACNDKNKREHSFIFNDEK